MPDPPIRKVCARCGSERVTRDAWAEWDCGAQQWVIGALFEQAHCHDCMGRARLAETPVAAG